MPSCFDCGFNKKDEPTTSEEVDLLNPPTLIGTCWGYLKERGKPMEIQATKGRDGRYLADVGCGKWTADRQDFKALAAPTGITEEEL